LTNSNGIDRDDSPSELLEFEPMLENKSAEAIGKDRQLPVDAQLQSSAQSASHPSIVPSTDPNFDLSSELDSLLKSIERSTPHPPDFTIADAETSSQLVSNPTSGTLVAIAAEESINYPQLHQDLITVAEQISTARAQLQSVHQRNQAQVDAVDANVLQVSKIKVRIKQLARYTKHQVEKAHETIGILDRIRTEIVTGLENFGGYTEIATMLTEFETIRAEAIAAQERLKNGQDSFYTSLQEIKTQIATQQNESAAKLYQYHELIQELSQTAVAERLQITDLSTNLSVNLRQVQDFNIQIADMHAQVTDKSHTIQMRIAEIDRGFAELAQSLRQDKEQFYELTAETIDRTDALRLQFADINNQIRIDREVIADLQAELESVSQTTDPDTEQQMEYFDLQLQELIDKYEYQQRAQSSKDRIFSRWLWGLSLGVGVIFVLLVRLLLSFY
jgi:chromosome segregation ATPase